MCGVLCFLSSSTEKNKREEAKGYACYECNEVYVNVQQVKPLLWHDNVKYCRKKFLFPAKPLKAAKWSKNSGWGLIVDIAINAQWL